MGWVMWLRKFDAATSIVPVTGGPRVPAAAFVTICRRDKGCEMGGGRRREGGVIAHNG